MKHLIIDKKIRNCLQCNHRNDGFSHCRHPEFPEGKALTNIKEEFPEWCPLPDVEEISKKTLDTIGTSIKSLAAGKTEKLVDLKKLEERLSEEEL